MKPLLQVVNTPELEKKAYSIRLGKDSNEWPVSILQEAYKQVPYLRNYEVDVSLDRMDESRGYGVGKMVVYPHKMEKNAAIKSDRAVSFPIIIRDHEMSPLDVVSHKDTILPASEGYVTEKLFQPELASRTAKQGQFSAQGLGQQIDPPTQRLRQSVGIHKHSSAKLLDAVLPTLTNNQVNSFKSDLSKSASLRVAVVNNTAFGQAVEKIISTKEKTAAAIKTEVRSNISPTTVQFKKVGSEYFIKTANHNFYSPIEKKVSRFEAQAYLSNNDFIKLCSDSYVTYTVSPIQTSPEIVKEASNASRIGVYSTLHNNTPVEGVVIPKMVSLDGQVMASQLFITKTASAMQENIAGMYASQTVLPSDTVRGKGVFAYQEGNRGLATEPVRITSHASLPGKEKLSYYIAKRLTTGEDIKLTVVPELKKIASMGKNHFAIPGNMRFISLPESTIRVCSSKQDFSEREMLKKASSMRLISDGNVFQIEGSPVFTDIMNETDASFALSVCGYASNQIGSLMEKSASVGYANLYHTRSINISSEVRKSLMSKIAFSRIDVSELKTNLIKEASVIVEKETVDSILALRFLTPENVGMYVNYLPELEKSASKLAEILIASRLGMDDVTEVSAKNALSQMSSVIEGLKSLQSKIN